MSLKKLLTSLTLFTIFATGTLAQTEQGVFRLGGDIMFDHQTYEMKTEVNGMELEDSESSASIFTIQLEPGLFVTNQFLIGVDLGFRNINYDDESFGGNEFFLGPQASYYIKSGNPEIYFPITVYGGYWTQSSEFDIIEEEEESVSGLYYGGNIGLEYIPGGNIGLRVSFGPEFRQATEEEEFLGSEVEISQKLTSWQFRIGFGFYFTKNEEEE